MAHTRLCRSWKISPPACLGRGGGRFFNARRNGLSPDLAAYPSLKAVFINGGLAQNRVSEPGRKADAANSTASDGSGTALEITGCFSDPNSERRPSAQAPTVGMKLYMPDDVTAQIARQSAKILKRELDSWLDERLAHFKEELSGSGVAPDAIEKVRAFVSRLRFPEQITRVMAHVERGGVVEMLVVHEYESHGEAICVVRRDFGATESDVPGAYFEFAYVKSDQFEAGDFRDFVDVLTQTPARPAARATEGPR